MTTENWYLRNKPRNMRKIRYAILLCKSARVKLVCTETIAQGCERCNFRFSRGPAVEVVPDFMKN